MTAAASWLLITIVVGLPTLLVGCALRLSGLAAEAEAKFVRTLRFKHCMKCAYEWDHISTELDPDLGETHVIETTCLACEYEAGRHIDIDLENTSLDEIKSIGRDQQLAVGAN